MEKLNFFEVRTFRGNILFVGKFLGQNFIHFFIHILLINLPISLIKGLFLYALINGYLPDFLYNQFIQNYTLSFYITLLNVLHSNYSIYTVITYFLLYQEKGPLAFNARDLLRKISFLKLIIITLFYLFWWFIKYVIDPLFSAPFTYLTLFLFFFFIIFTLWLGVKTIFFGIIIIRENLGFIKAIQRSFVLVKNKFWETLGVLLIFAFIATLINFIGQSIIFMLIFNPESFLYDLFLKGAISIALVNFFQYTILILIHIFIFSVIFTLYGHIIETKEKLTLNFKLEKFGNYAQYLEPTQNDQEDL